MLLKSIMITISGPKARYIHTTTSNNFKDYYYILGIPRHASTKEIKAAYYDKAKTYHPDANKGSTGSVQFQEISEAYEILGDQAKKRAYDKTTGSGSDFNQQEMYRYRQYRTDTTNAFRAAANEPLNMAHIHHVYKTLNRQPNEPEEPKFRIFEDHTYPGTDFNRFEYARVYNSETKTWVYKKRKDIYDYHKDMNRSTNIVKTCLFILTAGSIFGIINYRFLMKNLSNQSSRTSEDISRDRAGMYVIKDEHKPY